MAAAAMPLEDLERWLQARVDRHPAATSIPTLDGYVAAIVAGPVSMSPLDWICPLLAIDADAFNHGGTPEFAAISAVAQRHNEISNVLTTTPDRFEPMHQASIVTNNRRAPGGLFVLHARALPDNPYDGHTLRDVIDRTETLTGCPIERAYVDKGYRGHDAQNPRRVFISGQKRGVFGVIKRELRRRSAIEPIIGHLKAEGHLGRCYLKGRAGDAANVVLSAVGHNFRRILAWLRDFLCLLLFPLWRMPARPAPLNRAS
jgi:IS5 family transposase